MTKGSLVETLVDFTQLKIEWGLAYPNKGDILTVASVSKHPNKRVAAKGIYLLTFEEVPNSHGICDKTIHGILNFRELPPIDLSELLTQSHKTT